MAGGAEVLFVSKPVAPPWNDGTKNLVRDLAEALGARGRFRPVVCGRDDAAPAVAGARTIEVFPPGAAVHALGLLDSARLLVELSTGDVPPILHFVAAPTARAARPARAIAAARRRRTVQTVASLPEGPLGPGLFAEHVVVLSRTMEERVREVLPEAARLHRIPPPLAPLPPRDPEAVAALRRELSPDGAPIVVFAGDVGPGRGAGETVRALPWIPGSRLVLCARPKGARALEHVAALEALTAELGLRERASFVGETPRIHDHLAAADVVVLPATDPTGKIDLPLVLLEAMALERPVVVAKGAPAAELAEDGAAVAVEPAPEPLARAIRTLLGSAEERAELGARARRYVGEGHAPDRIAAAHEAIYEELLS